MTRTCALATTHLVLLCPERLPSCRGLPDGDQPVRNDLWSDRYVTCLINRTMAVNKCPKGAIFDPTLLQCRNTVPQRKFLLTACLKF